MQKKFAVPVLSLMLSLVCAVSYALDVDVWL